MCENLSRWPMRPALLMAVIRQFTALGADGLPRTVWRRRWNKTAEEVLKHIDVWLSLKVYVHFGKWHASNTPYNADYHREAMKCMVSTSMVCTTVLKCGSCWAVGTGIGVHRMHQEGGRGQHNKQKRRNKGKQGIRTAAFGHYSHSQSTHKHQCQIPCLPLCNPRSRKT